MQRLRSNLLIIWLATVSLVVIGIIIYIMNAPVEQVFIYLPADTEVLFGLSL